MQRPANGILITRQGTLDEISLDVSIRRDALAFATRVYATDGQLRSEAAKLARALEHVFDAPERPDILLSVGPKLPHSPSFEVAIRVERLGHVRALVNMIAALPDSAAPGSDTCTIHLTSDLACRDAFAVQLSGLSKQDGSTAQLLAE